MQKHALAVHDISCVGRCSLTVALPILSCAGVECSVLPTALLSTHTGEFTGFTCRDLTGEMGKITRHLESLGLVWDAVYTGFLGSYEQIALVGELFDRLTGPQTLRLVDPAMADHGALYKTYTPQMAQGTRELCRRAHVITPNLTEAAMLLGQPYEPRPTPRQVEDMLRGLRELGPRDVVITGVSRREGLTGAAAFDGAQVCWAEAEAYPRLFYGTGDVFASALLAGLMRGLPLGEALGLAVAFTHESIRHTLAEGRPLRYGPCFEKALPWLVDRLRGIPEAGGETAK